jgi:hypothetical protein
MRLEFVGEKGHSRLRITQASVALFHWWKLDRDDPSIGAEEK